MPLCLYLGRVDLDGFQDTSKSEIPYGSVEQTPGVSAYGFVPGRNRSSKYRRQLNSLHKGFFCHWAWITTMVSLLKKKKKAFIYSKPVQTVIRKHLKNIEAGILSQ